MVNKFLAVSAVLSHPIKRLFYLLLGTNVALSRESTLVLKTAEYNQDDGLVMCAKVTWSCFIRVYFDNLLSQLNIGVHNMTRKMIFAACLVLTLCSLGAEGLCSKGSVDCFTKSATLAAAAVTKNDLCRKYDDLYNCYITEGCEADDATGSTKAACVGQCGSCSGGGDAVKVSLSALIAAILLAYIYA